MRNRRIIPFSRDYRRERKFDMGLSTFGRRRRRVADPAVYLKRVVFVSAVLLMALQLLPDAAIAVVQRPEPSSCRVVSVVDGDTVRIWCPAKGLERARLTGFDTPEVFSPKCAQEFVQGTKATWALRYMLLQAGEVAIVKQGTDRYDRALAKLWVDGFPVSAKMIEKGLARPYSGGTRKGWCG
ncbi:thermonuclease family protein [Lutimaribacter marinistellae]|uniref:Thermonuclease family protein n=1 Tax=Lutimaribacter marinistellae TaxID=1820329 RepID=A0ABV7TM71_9RHOB